MLPHVFGIDCWCRPRWITLAAAGREGYALVHRRLWLTCDPVPRATARLSEGVPV